MDYRIVAFNVLATGATLYAFVRGGAPERIAGALLLTAALATLFVELTTGVAFVRAETGVLVIDVVLLVALVVLALHADRFWPFWIVALHALGTSAHLVKALDPTVLRLAYAILTKAWGYPITVILIAATLRHRQRVLRNGSDPDWSDQSLA